MLAFHGNGRSADEVAARTGNQRDELLYQLLRREHDMGGAIAPGLLEAQGKPAVGQFMQPTVRDGCSGKIATHVFEAVPWSQQSLPMLRG